MKTSLVFFIVIIMGLLPAAPVSGDLKRVHATWTGKPWYRAFDCTKVEYYHLWVNEPEGVVLVNVALSGVGIDAHLRGKNQNGSLNDFDEKVREIPLEVPKGEYLLVLSCMGGPGSGVIYDPTDNTPDPDIEDLGFFRYESTLPVEGQGEGVWFSYLWPPASGYEICLTASEAVAIRASTELVRLEFWSGSEIYFSDLGQKVILPPGMFRVRVYPRTNWPFVLELSWELSDEPTQAVFIPLVSR